MFSLLFKKFSLFSLISLICCNSKAYLKEKKTFTAQKSTFVPENTKQLKHFSLPKVMW